MKLSPRNYISLQRKILIVDLRLFILVSVIFASTLFHASAVSSTTPIVTLGDGIEASSTILGPSFSATNTDFFTLRTSTTSATVSNITVNLNAGGRSDGVSWAATTTTGTLNNTWTSVTYGDGTFVAVAATTTTANVMTSINGINWVIRTGTTTNLWKSVTYGNGMFVAVADSGASQRVMYSASGTSWTASTTAPNNTWQSITYGNGLFVAVAATTTTSNVMTSLDGITWTARTGATSNLWNSVTYANGLFVAVSSTGTGNRVMTSSDGITWTSRTSANNNRWTSITYGNGLFVAVSASTTASGQVMTSPDGITWTARTGSAFNASTTVAYGNGLFTIVAATSSVNSILKSYDGISWSATTSPVANQWKGLVYANGLFVSVANTGTSRIMSTASSTDQRNVLGRNTGTTWTSRAASITNGWSSVAYGNGTFVAVAYSGAGNRVMTSPDGLTWTTRGSAADNDWYSVTYGNGLFVAVSGTGVGNRVMTSPDGITWTSRTSATDNWWTSVTYGAGLFVAVSSTGSGDRVMRSSDGITWATSTSAANNAWNSVTYGNGRFVAVSVDGGASHVMTSTNGISWATTTSAADNQWLSVTYGNGLFVATAQTGSGNRIMTSPNGLTWTIRTSPADNGWSSVTYGNGLFVSTSYDGTNNRIMKSTNGITWATTTADIDNGWNAVTYGNGTFVAVGDGVGNDVMTSNSGTYYNNSEMYRGVSQVEVINNAGTIIYGSVDDPIADQINIPLQFSSITATTTASQYRIRITPKSHSNMPSAELGTSYPVKAKVTSITSTTGTVEGDDATGATITIDNLSTGITPTGITWTARTSATEGNWWVSVAYGNGLFVAVANSGTNRVMTSPDGITWTARTSATEGNWWVSVAYGNGLFVAVANSGTNRVMTSPDGITWTARTSAVEVNPWISVTYGNGLFVAVANSGTNRVMTSPDGITWTARTSATEANGWYSVTYGNGLFVAVATNNTIRVMTSSAYISSASNNRVSLTFTTPSESDLSSVHVLKSVDPVGDRPIEGTIYATTSKIGASDLVCSFAVATSTTYTCNSTFNTFNGTPYYFKIFTKDTYGNYSSAVTTSSSTPGRSITIGTGVDTASSTILPGATATTSNTFTLVTDQGTDVLQSVMVTFAAGTATSTGLLEITNDAGSQVYGSTATPTDVTVLPLTGLTVTTATTTYRIRITPKSHIDMPAPSVGVVYSLTTRISDWTGTNILNKNGLDFASTTITIDNKSSFNIDLLGDVWRQTGSSGNIWNSVTYGNGLFVAVSASTTNQNVMTSPDGITWTQRTGTTTNAWKSVAYGNGLFVAVACGVSSTSCNATAGNRVMTSTDGITWTLRTAAATNEWYSVTYGNGLFVAVSNSGTNRVMTSPDGITWTTRVSAVETNSWRSATYGNGLFVAVANTGSNSVMTSPDGITWTVRLPPANIGTWQSVTFGNNLFVAVSDSGNSVMTSPDGINWVMGSIVAGLESWSSVTYGNGLFVAVAASNASLTKSVDGISWSTPNFGSGTFWYTIAFGRGVFVSTNFYRIMTSSGPTATSSSNQITLTFTNPVDTDISTTTILRSTSPITDAPVEGVSYATSSTIGASTVACSFSVTASSTRTCTATGLTNGTPYYFKIFVQDATGNWSTGVALDPVAPGATGVTLGTGIDPVGGTLAPGGSATTSDTFTFQTTSGTDVIQSATVTFATGTAQALSLVEITSDNGATVYGSASNPSSDIVPVTLSTNTLTANTSLTQYRVRVTPKTHINMPASAVVPYFVTSRISSWVGTTAYQVGTDAGATTTLLTVDNVSTISVDLVGRNWNTRVAPSSNIWNSVTYGNGLFVAVSASTTNQNVMTSPDGITWTQRTGTTTNAWKSVAYGNGLFVAVACGVSSTSCNATAGNRVMTSTDGITWTLRTAAATNEWYSVTYGNGLFVAVSNSGTNRVMTSPDGITWTTRVSAVETNSWRSATYGNGLFVAVAYSGTNRVMTSPDGITWTARTSAVEGDTWSAITYGNALFVAVAEFGTNRIMTSSDGVTWATTSNPIFNSNWKSVIHGNNLFLAVGNLITAGSMYSSDGILWNSSILSSFTSWQSITYGNGLFVAVGNLSNRIMTSSGPTATSSSNQITLTFTNPVDTDISTTTILRSTSPITDAPVEGVSYATSSTIGASTVACSFSVTASSTRTCTATGLTNGTPYYFKIFVQDTTGNWSTGVALDPVAPGATGVTLGTGIDPIGGTLAPGGSATTSDTFTFQTTSGTDVIQSATVTFATGTAQALSLVEITSDNGATVYGSASNPSSDIVPVTLSTNTLTANTSLTQYRVRVTPKSHVNMPTAPGTTYYISSYVSSFIPTAAYNTGTDLNGSTTTLLTIDNTSPAAPTSAYGEVTAAKQFLLTYTNPSTTDATSTVVLRSTSAVTDAPVEGTTYTAGNTIGAATVVCVANNITLGAVNTCLDTTASRSTNYYYKIFSKDNTGNYSTGLTPSGLPFYIPSPRAAAIFYVEPEAESGATTTQSGGGQGGGSGGSEGGGGATTTQGGGGQGGGGGDSGNLYKPSNLATFFKRGVNLLLGQTGASVAQARVAVPISSASTNSTCMRKVFGICVLRNTQVPQK